MDHHEKKKKKSLSSDNSQGLYYHDIDINFRTVLVITIIGGDEPS